jgi:hypothetical protein
LNHFQLPNDFIRKLKHEQNVNLGVTTLNAVLLGLFHHKKDSANIMKLSSTTTALIFSLCLAVAASSAAAEMTKSYANSRRLQSETNEAYNPFNMNHSSPEFRYDYLYLEAQCQEKSDALDACLEDSCNSCQPLMLVSKWAVVGPCVVLLFLGSRMFWLC